VHLHLYYSSEHKTLKSLASYDPLSPCVLEEPTSFYTALRHEAPVYRLPNGIYVMSRFDDVQRAVMDTDTYSSNLVAMLMSTSGMTEDAQLVQLSGGEEQNMDVLAIADPPKHTRHRKVTNRAFTMRRVSAMEPRIRQLAESLMDNFLLQGGGDWIADVAVPLPMTIIVELLGFPPEDTARLKILSDAAVATLSGINTEQQMAENGAKILEMMEYVGARFDEAARSPGDNVLGDLVRASLEEGELFTRDGIVGMLIQLLTAGNESTSSLIGSAVLLLMREEGLQQQLRDNPELIDAFIEETLRLESPFKGHFRLTRKDTEVGGLHLPAGSHVMLLWGSANRDEAAFDNAEQIDLNRDVLKKHMAFGYGIHHCIGAPLARAESRIAIETLLEKTQTVRLGQGNDFTYIPSMLIRSLRQLNIECA
jgi:cytochrome P450 family 144